MRRVLSTVHNKGNYVDINNINIINSRQRKGIFTRIMRNLKDLKTIDFIVISSVCSDSMLNWCKKNNCKQVGIFDYRYK